MDKASGFLKGESVLFPSYTMVVGTKLKTCVFNDFLGFWIRIWEAGSNNPA